MFKVAEHNIIKRKKILKVFSAMAEGETMTYSALALKIGFSLDGNNQNPHFVWATRHAPGEGSVIRHIRETDTFQRLSKEDIASDVSRAKRIRNQAKSGLNEISVAMASNDKNIQQIASAKAARYSLIRDTAPTSNRKLVGNMI